MILKSVVPSTLTMRAANGGLGGEGSLRKSHVIKPKLDSNAISVLPLGTCFLSWITHQIMLISTMTGSANFMGRKSHRPALPASSSSNLPSFLQTLFPYLSRSFSHSYSAWYVFTFHLLFLCVFVLCFFLGLSSVLLYIFAAAASAAASLGSAAADPPTLPPPPNSPHLPPSSFFCRHF